ncbi:MAG: hypothetical protein WCG06_04040, partial [Candidatus Omnitrophota bacterium]
MKVLLVKIIFPSALIGILLCQAIVCAGPETAADQRWGSVSDISNAFSPDVAILEETFTAPASKMQIICIQDRAMDVQTQANIALIMDRLMRQQQIKFVFQEAGSGDLSLSILRHKASEEALRSVSRKYLNHGQINAAEYLSLVSSRSFALWGVEDQRLYEKAMIAYASLLEKIGPLFKYLQYVENAIAVLKPAVYAEPLRELDEAHEAYLRGELSLAAYSRLLEATAMRVIPADIPAENQPVFDCLEKLGRVESGIDFVKADRQKNEILDQMPFGEKNYFLGMGLTQLKLSEIGRASSEQKRDLILSFGKHAALAGRSGEFAKYLAYLEQSRSIDLAVVRAVQQRLVRSLFAKLFTSPDEKKLFEAAREVRTLRRLIDLSMDSEEFDRDRGIEARFDFAAVANFINRRARQYRVNNLKPVHAIARVEAREMLKGILTFYDDTAKRRQVFLHNLMYKMAQEGQNKAIFVTASYHLPAIKAFFRRNNISYAVVTPALSPQTPTVRRYDEMLLDQLFFVRPTLDTLYKPVLSRQLANR